MRIFITGATGAIGKRLVVDRLERGDQLALLSRNGEKTRARFAVDVNPNVSVVEGDVAIPGKWQQSVDGCDAVIHLAGAGIADRRWTKEYKQQIRNSRVDGTHQIAVAIREAKSPPKILISGSAIGYYGDTGDEPASETTSAGKGFLAEVCKDWEAQALSLNPEAIRVVVLRTAVVLDHRDGALPQMLTPFKFFIGGPTGVTKHWMSWIHWRDEIGLIDLALRNNDIRGALNACSPNPVSNWAFARAIGRAMGRPWFFAVPGFVLRIVLGEFAKFLTTDQRVVPAKAERHGYSFVHSDIDNAMDSLIGERPQQETINVAEASLNATQQAPSQSTEAKPPKKTAPIERIRLLAIDVDGTLLRRDQSLAPGVIQACRAAERNGCVVVLASARPPRGLRAIRQALDITSPTINFHGALIWNPLDNCAQYHEALDAEVAREVIEAVRAKDNDLLIGVETLDRWYTDRLDPALELEAGRVTEPDDVGPLERYLRSPISRLSIVGRQQQIQSVLPIVREQFWQPRCVGLHLTNPHLIQVTHPLADKGIALQRIANRLNVGREGVMAIGDGPNDAGMIEWAGFGVAVENAGDSLKQLADAVVPSNDDLGVARAIQRYVLSQSGSAAPQPV